MNDQAVLKPINLHSRLMAEAERIDLQRIAANETLKNLATSAADNPILKNAIDGERYFSPDTTGSAIKRILSMISHLSGSKTAPLELDREFTQGFFEAHRSQADNPHLIRDTLARALERVPAEQLKGSSQHQLRLLVWRALWLRPGTACAPRQERGGWVIRMPGATSLHDSLHTTIPRLIELLIDDPAELDAELDDYRAVLKAWNEAGSPVSRKILEDYRRIGFRIFTQKAEVILSLTDAEKLQIEMADIAGDKK
ncbi:MAG: hypothetical protein DDT25_00248 [Chloroflexi bacterium]|nr:hypothetical protein [Chloroflexota bacterium]